MLKAQGFSCQKDQYEFAAKPIQKRPECSILRAKHRITQTEVAVKVSSKKRLSDSAISQFKYEASILYKCRHRQIIQVLEVFETDDHIYMVTEFCEGGDL